MPTPMLVLIHLPQASVQEVPSTSMAQGAVVTVGQPVGVPSPATQVVPLRGVPAMLVAIPSV